MEANPRFEVTYLEEAADFLNSRSMVVATHGLVKKTQKTPAREIAHAEAIMELYYGQNK